jgi:hypothetical protein
VNHVPSAFISWLAHGERGMSSECIAEVMTGMAVGNPLVRDFSRHPYDPDDLRRCLLLLDIVPQWKVRIHEMAAVSPQWAALAARWGELEAAFIEEAPPNWREPRVHWNAPRTYELMQEVMS